jgi:hypothetical protein
MSLFEKKRPGSAQERAVHEFQKLMEFVRRKLPPDKLDRIRSSGIEGIDGLSDQEIIQSISFAVAATQSDDPEDLVFHAAKAEAAMTRMGVL